MIKIREEEEKETDNGEGKKDRFQLMFVDAKTTQG